MSADAVAKRDIPTMETYSGLFLDLSCPHPEQISLQDIAVGLANTCRFAGQVTKYYSVAEHSVRCAEEALARGYEGLVPLYCLLHDAHEAYTGDMTAPLKYTIDTEAPGLIKTIQSGLDWAIREHFELRAPYVNESTFVKVIDDYLLFREAAGLKWSHGVGAHWGNEDYIEPLASYGWPPAEAERRFIECYERLSSSSKD